MYVLYLNTVFYVSQVTIEYAQKFFYLVTFCVSRRRRKVYCGHTRLYVCLSVCLCVCLSVCPRPYAHITARTQM